MMKLPRGLVERALVEWLERYDYDGLKGTLGAEDGNNTIAHEADEFIRLFEAIERRWRADRDATCRCRRPMWAHNGDGLRESTYSLGPEGSVPCSGFYPQAQAERDIEDYPFLNDSNDDDEEI